MTTTDNLNRADDIEKNWMLAKGKKELLRHLRGEVLTSTEMLKSCCYLCMGGYGDDKVDCEIEMCPLHPKMPYNPKKHKSTRIMSEENKIKAGERMRKWQDEKKQESDE